MSMAKAILRAILIGVPVIFVALVSTTIGWRPFLGPRARALTNVRYEPTPGRMARGKYLVEAVTGCLDCHSPHDWTKPGAPITAGMEGAGEIFPVEGLPGRVVAPNITPDPETGIGSWPDDALGRAIREGVSPDGRALFPIMPYERYRAMSDEDLASIIVYLRSLPPVRNSLPRTQLIFPVRYLIRSVPQPVRKPVRRPDLSSPQLRGAYLVNLAACADCHTPQLRGRVIKGMDFAGGMVFAGPFGRVASANITPDPSGISYYDRDLFLEVIHTGKVRARALNPIMPVSVYRNLTDIDAGDMFAFLQALPPISHRVDNSDPPTYCRLCKQTHGLGSSN